MGIFTYLIDKFLGKKPENEIIEKENDDLVYFMPEPEKIMLEEEKIFPKSDEEIKTETYKEEKVFPPTEEEIKNKKIIDQKIKLALIQEKKEKIEKEKQLKKAINDAKQKEKDEARKIRIASRVLSVDKIPEKDIILEEKVATKGEIKKELKVREELKLKGIILPDINYRYAINYNTNSHKKPNRRELVEYCKTKALKEFERTPDRKIYYYKMIGLYKEEFYGY